MTSMPLAGVQLVAQDYIPFMIAMTNASSAVSKFGSGSTASLGGYSKAVGEATGNTNQFTLGNLALASALGNFASSALQGAIAKTNEFVQSSIQAVTQMQDLEINLQTLAAREYLYAGATDNMSDALKMGTGNAAYMLKQLENLSIASPFQYEQIISVFQMNMAFGQSSDMALKLTKAITNLGAVNKGIPGILQRLSYNFSQMSMVGKITARDTRDLAMAGLDLGKVFKLQLGKSVKEVNDAMQSGKMTFKEVSQALIDYTDKYIGPAAERASRTLGGLMSTMKDVSFFAGANLFKQSADIIAGALGNILDEVLNFVNSDAFKAVGVALAMASKQITNIIGLGDNFKAKTVVNMDMVAAAYGESSSMFSKSAQEMAKSSDEAEAATGKALVRQQDAVRAAMVFNNNEFYQSAKKAIKWGVDLMVNYADGIINGAASFLTKAIQWVSQMLTSWFQPHSPPKVAPEIDLWGLKTMNEYLHGFTMADFDILDTISGEIKNALSFASEMGAIAGEDVASLMYDLQKSIIGVLNGTENLDNVLASITNTTGPFGNEIAKLVGENVALAAATKEAEMWQKKLVQAQEDEYNAGMKVSKQVKEYNDMVRKGATKAELKAKMAEINATRTQQVEASNNRVEAEKNLKTSSKTVDDLKEQIALQSKLVNTMLDLGRASIAANEAKNGGKDNNNQQNDTTYDMPEPPDFDFFNEEMQKQIGKELDDMFGSIGTAFNEKWQGIFTDMQTQIGTFIGEFTGPVSTQLGSIATTIMNIWTPLWASLSATFNTAWTTIKNVWDTVGASISESWGFFVEQFNATGFDWATALQFVANVLSIVWAFIVAAITQAIGTILIVFGGLIAGVMTAVATFLAIVKQAQATLSLAWENIVRVFTDSSLSIPEKLGLIVTAIGQFFGAAIEMTFAGLIGIIAGIGQFFVTFYNAGTQLWQGIGQGIRDAFGKVWEQIVANFNQLITDTKAKLGIASPSTVFADIGKNLIQGLVDGINGMAATISSTIQGIITTITGFVTNFSTAGASLLQGMIDGINGAVQGVIDAAVAAAQGAIEAVKKALGIKSPSKEFIKIGVQTDEGMAAGMEKNQATQEASQNLAGNAVLAAQDSMNLLNSQYAKQMVSAYDSSVRGLVGRNLTNVGNGDRNVTIQFGNVSISNQAEGEMFQQRVEAAVLRALGA